jgi:hypothetical protein
MAEPNREDAATLVARLASIPRLEDLTQEAVNELLNELHLLLTPAALRTLVQKGIEQGGQIPFLVEEDKDEWRGGWVKLVDGRVPVTDYCQGDDLETLPDTERARVSQEARRFENDLERRLLWFLFKGLHRDARRIVFHALAGLYVIFPTAFALVYHLENGSLVGRLEGPVFASGVLGLLDIRDRHTFPFGRCARCGNVFVQPRRGRARRYCSERCKATGIPSAAKRTEYARTYRRRKRTKEIDVTKRILRQWPRDQQYAQLQKQFPTKSRREVVYLIRQAQPSPRARSERGRKET